VVLLFYLGFLLIGAVVGGIGIYLIARRRGALRQFARQFGLEYAPIDLFGLIDHRFHLFNQADGAKCSDVMWGNWHGVDVRIGELRFETDPGRAGWGHHRPGSGFSFAVAEIDAWVPHVAIRHDPLPLLANEFMQDRLLFESEEFNRTYRVVCQDLRFAYKFVDPRMMLWLIEMGESFRFDFEVSGNLLLVSCHRLKPNALVPLFGAAQGFHDHIPAIVLRNHPLLALATPQLGG
jgi:hypothetical protein